VDALMDILLDGRRAGIVSVVCVGTLHKHKLSMAGRAQVDLVVVSGHCPPRLWPRVLAGYFPTVPTTMPYTDGLVYSHGHGLYLLPSLESLEDAE
jgi:hypothetical protein